MHKVLQEVPNPAVERTCAKSRAGRSLLRWARMRGTFFRLLVGVSLMAMAPSTLPAANSDVDQRLIGTWRSDKARTIKHWCHSTELPPEKKERFESIFGKFTLRFTETHIHTDYEGEKQVVPYTVVASDDSSVVIRWNETDRQSLQHIHFDEEGYHVLSGNNVEFYTRVSAQQSGAADRQKAALFDVR